MPGEFTERLVPAGGANRETATTALPGSTGLVVLDTAVTPELAAEGTARDVVRVVQQARREAGLDVSDRVALTLDGPPAVLDAVRAHEAFLAGEVLATAVAYHPVPEPTLVGPVAGDGGPAEIRVLVTR